MTDPPSSSTPSQSEDEQEEEKKEEEEVEERSPALYISPSETKKPLPKIEIFKNYLNDVKYEPWGFRLNTAGGRIYLQAAPDEESFSKAIRWDISKFASKQIVIRTAFRAICEEMTRHCSENFMYRGAPIYSPNTCVDTLVESVKPGST